MVAPFLSLVVLGTPAAALAKTSTGDSSCRTSVVVNGSSPEVDESVPTELSTSLETGVLARFAVLRRAALPGDRIPLFSPVAFQIDGQLASYYPAYVREVKTLSNGSRYFLIPGFAHPQSIPPARCLPPSQRAERQKLVEQAARLADEPVYCIVLIGREGGPSECEPFAEVEQAPRVFQPTVSQEATVELVPDGVASVRAAYVIGAPVTITVAENVYALTPPAAVRLREHKLLKQGERRVERDKHPTKAQRRRAFNAFLKLVKKVLAEAEPTKLEWLDSAGQPIRTISRPSSKAGGLIELSTVFAAG